MYYRLVVLVLLMLPVLPAAAGEFQVYEQNTQAVDVSNDGRVVVGLDGYTTFELVRWIGTERLLIPSPPGVTSIRRAAVSPDGTWIVLEGFLADGRRRGWVWTEADGLVALGLPPGDWYHVHPFAVSNDGLVVGSVREEGGLSNPFRWTGGGGFQPVRPIDGFDTHASFSDVSADGSIAVGESMITGTGLVAATSTDGAQMTALPANGGRGSAAAVTPDGRIVIGWVGADGPTMWVDGQRDPIGGGLDQARFVSADGRVVGDHYELWTEETGAISIEDYATMNDVDIPDGWSYLYASGIAGDGRTIVGYGGAPDGFPRGWRLSLDSDVDTDGDGLLDSWEEYGIPYVDANGDERRYLLDIDGDGQTDCDPEIPDLFVEIDAMAGLAPSGTAIGKVEVAFALANVRLHVDLDETNLTQSGWTLDDTNNDGRDDWPTEFDDLKLTAASGTTLAGHFGTVAERDDPDAEAIREAKKKAFRYCIFAHEQDPGKSTSGRAELPGGNDFFVTLGHWDDGNGNGGGTTDEQAGTFMHELGHTLGLLHGGGQDTNLKPNYYSVMSYNWQTPKSWHVPGSWPLSPTRRGYSFFALPDLDEHALDECFPLVLPSSSIAGVHFPHNTHDEDDVPVVEYARYGDPINWNGDTCDLGVAVDINYVRPDYRSSGDDLLGHDDWVALRYDFRDMVTYADGVHDDGSGDEHQEELTYEEHLALDVILPAHCHGDIDDDRAVDFNDLILVLDAWGPCPGGCRADIAPIGFIDGQVDFQDLLAVLDGWGPCS